ncbi:uncharacterized protein LOC117169769 [Belonocnema kinseyi]|uniref:uncharacterized protein LOC117169769 n=1 Tax=Belonocnema kinseyi TaxID=2817044 RepID=UPI00143CD021|nr:uncharacterized protein LOC117169769 [Belonocnema kinseyi]
MEAKASLENGNAISSHLNATKENRSPSLLATARVIIEAPNGRCVHVRALLDQGSQATFVSESVVQLLRLPRKKFDVTVSGLGGNLSDKILHSVSFTIKSPKFCATTFTTQVFVISRITAYVPAEFMLMKIPSNLRELDLADPTPGSNDRIDLLIGADLFGQALLSGVCHDKSRNLGAQNKIFGWILSGSRKTSNVQAFHINVHHSANIVIDEALRRFWELGDSRDIALSSLLHLEKRLERNADVSINYHEFMRDYELLGHMSRIGPMDDDNSFRVFIPHHPVLRDHSQTMKLRIVFNASRPTSSKVSLNDCLHIGPKLQNDISSILLRWRQHRYVLYADIAHMFFIERS